MTLLRGKQVSSAPPGLNRGAYLRDSGMAGGTGGALTLRSMTLGMSQAGT
jgi:hypothetical protein